MRLLAATFMLISLILAASQVMANPPCPRSANSLEEFAVCMRPTANGSGQVLVGYSSSAPDYHHAALMRSMNNYVVTPHVYPAVSATSVLSNMMVGMGYAYRYRNKWGYYPMAPYYPYLPMGFWFYVRP